MKLKQLWCAVIKKHPGRKYATIEEIIKAEKDHSTVAIETCMRCGKIIRKKDANA